MGNTPKLKKLTGPVLKRRLRAALACILIGIAIVGFSVCVGILMNTSRYGSGASPVEVAARVIGTEAVFEEDEIDGTFVSQGKWFLTARFQFNGETHELRLDEWYVDETYAEQQIGGMRELCVDADSFVELHARPLNFVFCIGLCFGLVFVVAGCLLRFRYSDYRSRLFPRRKPNAAPAFVIARGRGV